MPKISMFYNRLLKVAFDEKMALEPNSTTKVSSRSEDFSSTHKEFNLPLSTDVGLNSLPFKPSHPRLDI